MAKTKNGASLTMGDRIIMEGVLIEIMRKAKNPDPKDQLRHYYDVKEVATGVVRQAYTTGFVIHNLV